MWGRVPTHRPARERPQGGDADDGEGVTAEVYRDGDDVGEQQLDVRALLPFSGVVLPRAESKDGVASWFFSHPILNDKCNNDCSSCLLCTNTRH